MAEEDPVRFGAEFGPKRTENSTGVSLSTFKSLVWVSNLGGLLLCAIGLELIVVQQQAYWGLGAIIAGVIVALFPSNYEMSRIMSPKSNQIRKVMKNSGISLTKMSRARNNSKLYGTGLDINTIRSYFFQI